MGLTIRLRKQGRVNRPFYRVVIADSRWKRDGKYLEALGWYNPMESQEDKALSINAERIAHWLSFGAEISDNVRALVAKTAPEVIKQHTQKAVAHRAKMAAKRKARKSAAA